MSAGIDKLKSELPSGAWTQDLDIITPHLREWRDKYFGQTPIMLSPRSTEEVAISVKICAEHKLAIMPQGGNTGLVGGNTPQGEVLISLKKMSKVREINPTSNAMIVEAGATLQSVLDAADQAGRKFPLTLSSQGSCTIGGVISTNAGGNHVLKYGTTKDLIFGVEAVLADGSIFNGLTSLRKDNTGYDLNRLFLGAEGTLGIVTAASLKLFPKPGYVQRALIGVRDTAKAVSLLEDFRSGGRLYMFEVMPRIGFEAVIENFENIRDPFEARHNWYLLCDWEVDNPEDGQALSESIITKAFEAEKIQDAVIAQNETQAADLLSIRENMSEAQKFLGGSIKHDITIPIDRIPEFFEQADPALATFIPGCRPVAFGHFGDGNIHYNISQPIGMDKEKYLSKWEEMSRIVFDIVGEFGGSISAEHGIGIMKRDDLVERSDPVKIQLLRSIKIALDPDRIMNPRVMI